jgi:formylglycine-generating enzyme required for sulfatase activity
VPEGIRFWKGRIEAGDSDRTFASGLIYGPSGCGKSSLVKAGLLPRLAGQVIAVYIEATADDTEDRLLKGLRKQCPAVPTDLGLVESMGALRRGQGIPAGKKVLIVLDQFEQWLHAREAENSELVQALRQCDGGRVQCLVMVRDDFWMAATRFMDALEVRLVQGDNTAAVDLFDLRHARKVLAAFGRAFGALPEGEQGSAKDQVVFLEQAVAGLAQEGKVISVRLALFAEMVKDKPWTPATLKEVGGVEGLGVAFLEETFGAATAPPQHRLHQTAARAVLKALLPETGTDLKGHRRSREELFAATGYTRRPQKFEELLRILDAELRLITPTDPGGAGPEGKEDEGRGPAAPSYQLTHDYLVPELRLWLTRKQRETRRGRAELRLAERAALWKVKREKRHLPSWWEWLTIRLLTRTRDWSPPQRAIMRAAGRHYAVRTAVQLLLVCGAVWLAVESISYWWAFSLLRNLDRAQDSELPSLIDELRLHRRWARSILKDRLNKAGAGDARACRVLLELYPEEADSVCSHLLSADNDEMVYALREKGAFLKAPLWAVLDRPESRAGEHARAAFALLLYDPGDRRWDERAGELAARLVKLQHGPLSRNQWLNSSKLWASPTGAMVTALAEIVGDDKRPRTEQESARWLLLICESKSPELLAELVLFESMRDKDAVVRSDWSKQAGYQDRVVSLLEEEFSRTPPPGAAAEVRHRLTRRRHNAAAALFTFGKPERVPAEVFADCLLDLGYFGDQPIDRTLSPKAMWPFRDRVASLLEGELTRETDPRAGAEERKALARRRGNALRALIELHRTEVIRAELLTESCIGETGLSADLAEKALLEKSGDYKARVISLLKEELTGKPPLEAPEAAQEGLAERQARAALMLFSLGEPEVVWPLLRRRKDPSLRTLLIARLRWTGAEWTKVALDRLDVEPDAGVRAALLLSVGDQRNLSTPETVPALLRRYREDPDPGVHSAVAWLLWQVESGPRQMEQIDRDLVSREPIGRRRWYLNGQGHTLALVPGPCEFLMGSPEDEQGRGKDEGLHPRRIPRSYAIGTREVNVEQFKRFLKENPAVARHRTEIDELGPEAAVSSVDWFEAAQYCRWLSEREKVPEDQMCYPPVADIEDARGRKEGLKLPADYLTRTGYRLPTEAEREYACRAGTTTSRSWGPTEAWGQDYDGFGLPKPNDLGLFNMQWGVSEWCHDRYLPYPKNKDGQVTEDREDAAAVICAAPRVLRGSATDPEMDSRSARRASMPPTQRSPSVGFRVARTHH